jgi:hypothetical protein
MRIVEGGRSRSRRRSKRITEQKQREAARKQQRER